MRNTLLALLLLALAATAAHAFQAEVEMKNGEAMAILVHLGQQDGQLFIGQVETAGAATVVTDQGLLFFSRVEFAELRCG